MDRLQAAVVDVRVDLGRPNAGVTQQFLQGTYFCPAGQHVRSKAMPQGMWAYLTTRPNPRGVTLYQLPNRDS